MPIGNHIRNLRWARRLKQGELAHRAGIAQNTLSQIELGKTTPSVPTLEKIARGLSLDLSELLEEPVLAGNGEALQETGSADVHGLFDERQTETDWREAYDNSQRFRRADAKERLRERLELWEAARDEGASDELRRRLLDEVGLILDEANEVVGKLLENAGDGMDGMAKPSPEGTPNAYWTEVQKADTLYRELRAMVEGMGLSVRSKTPSDTARARRHELKALAR
jgi:transcriptional regulator with XRE-family HTH domain